MAVNNNTGNQFSQQDVARAEQMTFQARSLTEELKDQLGIRSRLNETEKAQLDLARQIQRSAQENTVEIGNQGNISRQLIKDEKLLLKVQNEKTALEKQTTQAQQTRAKLIYRAQSRIQQIQEDLVNSSGQQRTALEGQLNTAEGLLQRILRNADADSQRLALAYGMESTQQALIRQRQEEEQIQKKINDKMGVTGALVKGTGALMERLGMRSGIFQDAMKDSAEEMRKMAEETVRGEANFSKLQIMAKGFSELAKGFRKALFDPLTIITAIVSKAFELNAASVKLQRLTGQVRDKQAAHNSSLASGAQVMEVMAEMTERTGIAASAMFSSEDLGRLAEAKNLLGLSSEQASNLGMLSKASGTSIQGYKEQVVSSVNEFNALNDSAVAHGVIMQDVLNASADVSMSLGGSAPKIAAAAAAARKLGLDLTKVNQIADGLLDFESSIESELEAQLLTGKNINLNKARELALNNDLEGVANELAKNGASAAEFAKMNRIQQEGMAKALGMSREEMGKMLINQEGQKNLSKEQRAAMRGVTLEQLEQMEASESLQLAFGKIAEPLASILSQFAPIVTMIAKAVAFVAPLAPYLLVAYGASKLLAGGFINIAASAGGLGKSLMDKGKGVMGFFSNFKSNMAGVKSGFKDFANAARGALTGKVQSKAGDWYDKDSPQGKMIQNMKKGGDKTAEAGKGIADSSKATKSVKPGKNIKTFLKNLAEGLKEMASMKVLYGALNLIPASIGLVTMIPGVVGAKLMELISGPKLLLSMQLLAQGFKEMAGMKVLYGALNLIPASLGLVAMIPGVVGAKLMELISGPKLLLSMQSLAQGLTAMGTGKVLLGSLGLLATAVAFIAMIPASAGMALMGLTAPMAAAGIFALIPALTALGTAMISGVGALGLAALIGMAVGLGAGFALIGAGAMMLGKGIQFAAQGFVSIFGQLGTLVTMLPQLYLLGGALMSIAAGLGMIAIAGIAAIPALSILTGFALVVTPLIALGGLFGDSGDSEDDGFAKLEAKLDQLISVISAGGDVYLDGDKVGMTQAKSMTLFS